MKDGVAVRTRESPHSSTHRLTDSPLYASASSPTRTAVFTGRYPHRTNVTTALLPPDLAGNQLKPYEVTTPNVLRRAGYVSGLFGKAHFTNTPSDEFPTTAPYGPTPVTQLGWDYFNGWNDGGPLSIDTTAGGAGAQGQYPCGFVPGNVSGACHYINGTCAFKQPTAPDARFPGIDCLSEGGILLPGETCAQPPSVGESKWWWWWRSGLRPVGLCMPDTPPTPTPRARVRQRERVLRRAGRHHPQPPERGPDFPARPVGDWEAVPDPAGDPRGHSLDQRAEARRQPMDGHRQLFECAHAAPGTHLSVCP